MVRSKLALVALLGVFGFRCASVVVPIPRFHVDDLSVEDFDNKFVGKEPVILTGASTCPVGVGFDDLRNYCMGKIGDYVKVKMRKDQTGRWAGLTSAKEDSNMQIVDFLEGMGNSSNPRFAFDIQMHRFCPGLLPRVKLPAHFATIFSGQWLYRHMWDADYRKCVDLPFYNSYLAEAGFESDMHIDHGHTSFTSSMCEGEKRWRIFSPQNMSAFKEDFSDSGQTFHDEAQAPSGAFLDLEMPSPFDSWSPESPMLTKPGLVVFEGVLSPGETLFIPAGAPHAAITLSKSWMVASNDRTLLDAADIKHVCDKLRDTDAYRRFCKKSEAPVNKSLENFKWYKGSASRKPMSFLEAAGCKRVDMDRVRNSHDNMGKLTQVTPDNLYDLLAEGPLLIFKLKTRAYWSAVLRPQLPFMPERFNPKLRVGVVCDGGCVTTPWNASELVVSKAYFNDANGVYSWQNDTLFKRRDGKATIFFDKVWRLSVEGNTFGDDYEFEYSEDSPAVNDPEDWGNVMTWSIKVLIVTNADVGEANGLYTWQGNQSYQHSESSSRISFDGVFWELRIAGGQDNAEHNFQWKGAELGENMTWHSRDGDKSCSVLATNSTKGGNASVVQEIPQHWAALLDMNAQLPEYMLVQHSTRGMVKRGKTLNFTVEYFVGLPEHDLILTWASVLTGFEVNGLEFKWKLLCLTNSYALWLLSRVVLAFGYQAYTDGPLEVAPGIWIPDGGTIAVAGVYLGVIAVLLISICCCSCCCRSRSSKPKSD